MRYWWISRLDSTFSYRYMNHLLLYVGLRYFLFISGWDLNFCKHFSCLYNEVLACHLQFEILLLATNTGKEYTLYMLVIDLKNVLLFSFKVMSYQFIKHDFVCCECQMERNFYFVEIKMK